MSALLGMLLKISSVQATEGNDDGGNQFSYTDESRWELSEASAVDRLRLICGAMDTSSQVKISGIAKLSAENLEAIVCC